MISHVVVFQPAAALAAGLLALLNRPLSIVAATYLVVPGTAGPWLYLMQEFPLRMPW